MTVLELMERTGMREETLAIAYIKDAIHLIQSNTKEKIKVNKQNILNASDNDKYGLYWFKAVLHTGIFSFKIVFKQNLFTAV